MAADVPSVDPAHTLRVFILYADTHAGKRALGLTQKLTSKLAPQYHFAIALWNLAVVTEPGLSQAAAREIAAAHIVIVAANEPAALALETQQWLRRWSEAPHQIPGALLLLAGTNANQTALDLWASEFAQLAAAARWDYIRPDRSLHLACCSLESLETRARASTRVLEGFGRRADRYSPRWMR